MPLNPGEIISAGQCSAVFGQVRCAVDDYGAVPEPRGRDPRDGIDVGGWRERLGI
ncbi:MAG TPA: hypothetical protein VKD26_08190 [Streptosporangiaceae bacterium]|nr:hypothetical protein [Streptosporangiaceae bacterium]